MGVCVGVPPMITPSGHSHCTAGEKALDLLRTTRKRLPGGTKPGMHTPSGAVFPARSPPSPRAGSSKGRHAVRLRRCRGRESCRTCSRQCRRIQHRHRRNQPWSHCLVGDGSPTTPPPPSRGATAGRRWGLIPVVRARWHGAARARLCASSAAGARVARRLVARAGREAHEQQHQTHCDDSPHGNTPSGRQMGLPRIAVPTHVPAACLPSRFRWEHQERRKSTSSALNV
jgi:hypothetical protein